jgi:exonuclease SbcD
MGADTRGALDKETHLPGRVMDFLDSLDAMIDYAVCEDVDAVIFTGDAFHHHSPNPTYFQEFGERIIRLSEQCPVVIVVGNHDMPGSLDKASAVDVFTTLKVPNVIVGWDYDVHKIDTKHGRLQIATFPYPIKQQFLDTKEIKFPNSAELFQERVCYMIHELESMLSEDEPAVFAGHFSVSEAMFGSEQSMTIGTSADIPIKELISDKWSYVALGHLHHHQSLSAAGEVPVVYAGSLDRVDFSEENDDKGFIDVSIYDEDGIYPAEWEFVSVDPRPFKTIRVEATTSQNITKKVLVIISKRDLKDHVVRVIVSATEDNADTYVANVIEEALKSAGVYLVHGMRLDIKREQRNRLELEEGEDIATYSHLELLDIYFQTRDLEDDKINKLLDLAKSVMEDVNDSKKF